MKTLLIVCSLLLGPITHSAYAQMETPTPTPTAAPLTVDQNFLVAASQLNTAEISLSQVAAQKSTRSRIRSFATTMVLDHTQVATQLAALAGTQGVTLPTELDPLHLVSFDTLNTVQGRTFNRNYVTQMVFDHQQTIRLFQNEALVGTDPQIRAFAQAQLPTLRRHLVQAVRLYEAVVLQAR